MYLNILDINGKPITDIDSSKIVIIEENTNEKVNPSIQNFYNSEQGIAICFLVDISYSMDGPPLDNVKEGMLSILSELRSQDKMAIGKFNEQFFKQTGFEMDREILRNNINQLEAKGSSTNIYDAVIETIKWLQSLEVPKRKILVLISDGENLDSKNTLDDAISEAKKSGLTIFSIGSIAETKESKGTLRNIEQISSATSDGKYYRIKTPSDMKHIIPLIYSRIKEEYILSYYSNAGANTNIKGSIEVKYNDSIYVRNFSYQAPSKIVKHAPAVSFFKTDTFIFGGTGILIILIGLIIFLFVNISKKKKYRAEKEKEKELREKETRENRERFEQLKAEYDELLDTLENQKEISESEKKKIFELESMIENAGKTISGAVPKIDVRRRTMILDGKSAPDIPQIEEMPVIIIRNGINAGKQFQISNFGITIGRMEGSIILQDSTISRRHARIIFSDNKYIIEDLGSTNGTFVNNRRISQQILKNGDMLRLGDIEMLFRM